MNQRGYWLKGVVVAWGVLVIVALLVYGLNKQQPFDPDAVLLQASMNQQFDVIFADYLKDKGIKPGTVVHFTQPSACYCDALSHQHQMALHKLLSPEYVFSIQTLDDTLRQWLPSYPALAVLDLAGQLRYLGPYASGLGCYVGDDTVKTIAKVAKEAENNGAVVVTDSIGCYCTSTQ